MKSFEFLCLSSYGVEIVLDALFERERSGYSIVSLGFVVMSIDLSLW